MSSFSAYYHSILLIIFCYCNDVMFAKVFEVKEKYQNASVNSILTKHVNGYITNTKFSVKLNASALKNDKINSLITNAKLNLQIITKNKIATTAKVTPKNKTIVSKIKANDSTTSRLNITSKAVTKPTKADSSTTKFEVTNKIAKTFTTIKPITTLKLNFTSKSKLISVSPKLINKSITTKNVINIKSGKLITENILIILSGSTTKLPKKILKKNSNQTKSKSIQTTQSTPKQFTTKTTLEKTTTTMLLSSLSLQQRSCSFENKNYTHLYTWIYKLLFNVTCDDGTIKV